MYFRKQISLSGNQDGAALVIGLLILLVVTLISVTAMKSTLLQEKMAAGLKNTIQSRESANSALRIGESFLWNYFKTNNGVQLVATDDGSGVGGIYKPNALDIQTFLQARDPVSVGVPVAIDTTIYPRPARYVIEDVCAKPVGAVGLISQACQAGVGGAEFDDGGGTGAAAKPRIFRISSRGWSGNQNVLSVVQSTYMVKM
jgi:type IV pilus assembly protein PilX